VEASAIGAIAQRLSRVTPFYYGWVIVVIAGLANASRVSSAVEVSSVFVPALTEEYGWSKTVIASGTTIGGIGVMLAGPFVGRILDRYGSRAVVPIGATLTGLGCFVLAGVTVAPMFIVVYAFVRLSGQAFVQFPNQVTVAKWFSRRRGRASALLVGLGATGLITAPVAVTAIIGRYGMGEAWVALGVLAIVLGVVPTLVLGARRPEDLGLLPDGDEAPPEDANGQAPGGVEPDDWTLSEAVRTPTLWWVAISGGLYSLSSTGVGFHQLAYYVEQGISRGTAAAVVSTFAIGLTTGGITWGMLADRVSVRALITLGYALATGLMLALLGADTPPEAFAISFASGLLVGGALSLPTLLCANYFGRGNLGAISGILQMTRGVSLGSGPVVAALIYDFTGGYARAFMTFAVLCAVAFVMMLFARRPVRRLSPAEAVG
jgi:MFS family permease